MSEYLGLDRWTNPLRKKLKESVEQNINFTPLPDDLKSWIAYKLGIQLSPVDISEVPDSLRLESQTVKPDEFKRLRAIAHEQLEQIKKEYLQYVPENKKHLFDHLPNRLIVLNDPGDFRDHYDGGNHSVVSEKLSGRAYSKRKGDIVSIIRPDDEWTRKSDKRKKEIIAKYNWSDIKTPPPVWSVNVSRYYTTHEFLHKFQADMPEAMYEACVRYFTTKVGGTQGWEDVFSGLDRRASTGISKLVAKYGDDVHRVFFGSKLDESRKKNILEDFESIKGEIYPTGKYEIK